MTVSERLALHSMPVTESGCLIWIGATDRNGYEQIGIKRRTKYAHIISYLESGGIIPDGFELDHLCRVRCCINPTHLEPVTHSINSQRGDAGNMRGKQMAQRTHCPAGHAYDEQNTYRVSVKRKQGIYTERHCRACHNQVERKRRVSI